MNTGTTRLFEQTTMAKAMAGMLLMGGMLVGGAARADTEEAAIAEVRAAIAADPDNVVRTLKTGRAAQEHRWATEMEQLDPETRMRLEGRTDDAQALRERGNGTKHVHDDLKRRQKFDEILDDGTPRSQDVSATARARHDVEQLGHHPEELDRLQRTGEHTRAHRARLARDAQPAQGRSPSPDTAGLEQHRGEPARRYRSAGIDAPRRAPAARVGAGAAVPEAPRTHARASGLARGVAGGMAVGWAAETALGTHVPDPIEAVTWTGDTLQRPQDMPKRMGQLATGAAQFTGQVATQLTRPDRMAVNLANGAVDVARTGAYMAAHPQQAVTAVGNTAIGVSAAVGHAAVGLAKGGVHVATHPQQTVAAAGRTVVGAGQGVARAVSRPAKTVRTIGCGVDRLFKPGKKC